MDKWQINRIRENLPELIEITVCNDSFLAYFIKQEILSRADIDDLKRRFTTEHEKNYRFYEIIQNRTGAFWVLLGSLHYTKQTGAFALLSNCKPNSKNIFESSKALLDKKVDVGSFNINLVLSKFCKYTLYIAVVLSCGYVIVKLVIKKDKISVFFGKGAASIKTKLISKWWMVYKNFGIDLGKLITKPLPYARNLKNSLSLNFLDKGEIFQKEVPSKLLDSTCRDINPSIVCPNCGNSYKSFVPETLEQAVCQITESISPVQHNLMKNGFTKWMKVWALGGIGGAMTVIGLMGCVFPSALIVPAAVWSTFTGRSFALKAASLAVKPEVAGPAIFIGTTAVAGAAVNLIGLPRN